MKLGEKCGFIVVLVVSLGVCCRARPDSVQLGKDPLLKLTANPTKPCTEDQLGDLCFWKNITTYPASSEVVTNPYIGTIGSSANAIECGVIDRKYEVLTGKDLVNLSENYDEQGVLGRNIELTNNTKLTSVNVSCSLITLQGYTHIFYKLIKIEMSKPYCDPTVAQHHHLIHKFHRKHIRKGDSIDNLIFLDEAPMGVNSYKSYIRELKKTGIKEVFHPNCTTYPDYRDGGNRTVIHCALYANRSRELKDDIEFDLRVKTYNDLCPVVGEFGSMRITLQYSPPDNKAPEKERLFLSSKIFRTAAPYARVTQPNKTAIIGFTSFTCHVLNSTRNPFGITNEGIIYVNDSLGLRNAAEELRLNISWLKSGRVHSEEVTVRLVVEPTITCSDRLKENDWVSCSEHKSKKKCESKNSCGLGTGGSAGFEMRHYNSDKYRCVWRGDKRPQNHDTHLYSTCTPDIEFCPNDICDSLEILKEDYICPQDCTKKTAFPARLNAKTGRGIDKCNGVLECHDTGCTCIQELSRLFEVENNVVGDKLVSGKDKQEEENSICDTECILIATGGVSLVTFSILFSILIWRNIRIKKLAKDKYLENLQEAETPFSDYIERNVNNEPLVLNFQMNTTLDYSTNNPKLTQVDPKWKFPRKHIVIEQVLGEGEFGRVLRAKAFNIAGRQGYALVAVKTLKNEARTQDYNDLFSEYQLLKEVKHPHVIQLLGVCPSEDGGPLYLIIEYAAYGSLRNYLRRSRHILTTTELGNLEDNLGYKVTPKEILSFARQISSGMSYISDIKLVHRDLAARNILLAENKVCKISDFGLTRDIYEDNAYFKKSKGRVPVKWMAPESLADHLYTTKSDVWSFGILIWELVTLGASPYPGIQVQNLYNLLHQGYRMERPPNCSTVLYSIMNRCWNIDPDARPSFLELYHCFDKLLTDNVSYLDLSDNAIINKSYFSTFAIDAYSSASGDTVDEKENFLKNNLYKDRLENEDKWRNPMEGLKVNCHPGYETPVKAPKPVNIFVNEASGEYTDMSAKL